MKILLVLFVLFLVGCSQRPSVEFDQVRVDVEIADEPTEQEQGLQGREHLCATCGMLFVFNTQELHRFWMKETIIPLDMIFIGDRMRVVDIHTAQPCIEEICPVYTPSQEAKYVLEVNAGFAEAYGLSLGDDVDI